MKPDKKIQRFLDAIRDENVAVYKRHGIFHGAHEGWAVIYEELDELWDEVRRKRSARDQDNMYRECVQIAAMAMKFALELCDK